MLIDSHIHVGQFFNDYFAPSTIHKLVEQIGIDFYAVSSTTQCEENYPKVLSELQELIQLDGDKVLPIMWITPDALEGNIAWYLESDIKWKMIKIHPFLNKKAWHPKNHLLGEVIDIAREMNLPILIHTGEDSYCRSGIYKNVIENNKDIIFILAHGRPLNEAVSLAKKYPNVFVDSAFMPISEIKTFIDEALANKLLWGTDMYIPKHFYPNEDMITYYARKIEATKKICTQEEYDLIIYKNAVKLFNIT